MTIMTIMRMILDFWKDIWREIWREKMAFGGNFGGKKWQEGIWREKIEFWREKWPLEGNLEGIFDTNHWQPWF